MQPQSMHRSGTRIEARAPFGRLVHEVRLTYQGERWLARIVTLPRQIWTTADGSGALTFEGATAEEADRKAAEFIEHECLTRGHRVGSEPDASPKAADDSVAFRVPRVFPVRFIPSGEMETSSNRFMRSGMTGNLSESGIFIASEFLVRPGERVTIDLRMPGLHERMEGEVIWTRQTHSPGRPVGMGIRLLSPSLNYRSRIQSLR